MRSPKLKMGVKCQTDKDKPYEDLMRFHEWVEKQPRSASVGLRKATSSGNIVQALLTASLLSVQRRKLEIILRTWRYVCACTFLHL